MRTMNLLTMAVTALEAKRAENARLKVAYEDLIRDLIQVEGEAYDERAAHAKTKRDFIAFLWQRHLRLDDPLPRPKIVKRWGP